MTWWNRWRRPKQPAPSWQSVVKDMLMPNELYRAPSEFAPKRTLEPPPAPPRRRPPPCTVHEMAAGLRAMTYENFTEFADAIGANPDRLWQWALRG
jgi:hypothetical protein